MRAYASFLLMLVMAAAAAGCDGEEQLSVDGATPTRATDETVDGYRVILRGVVNDTLSGRTQFGEVYDATRENLTPVIELVSNADFAGGMFITTNRASWPAEGRYPIGDGTGEGEHFRVVYREGLYRSFQSVTGSLLLSVSTDTLIRGSFDAVMRGEVAEGGREPVSGEIEVSAAFSARPGRPGYIIGL